MTTAQITILQAELANDPLAIGYANKSDQAIADLLNDPTKAAGGPLISKTLIPSYQLYSALDATEFASLTALQLQRLSVLLSGGQIDATDPNTRTLLAAIFPANGPTRTALLTLIKRQGSRVEQLLGIGTAVTNSDISFALRGAK